MADQVCEDVACRQPVLKAGVFILTLFQLSRAAILFY